MGHDLFISYAHQGDNTSREAVVALVARLHEELEADFRRHFNRDLEIFFDKEDIRDFHHWQVQCHRALRDSRFFIACLSRTYLRSDACRWEWEEWCRHELEHGLVGQGAASLWFVKLEDLDAPEDAALLRRWKGDLLQRFHVQCHEWRHDDQGNFLDAAARSELQQLTEHVAQRLRLLTLDRARQGNLPWPNANFVGRESELAGLRAALLDAPEQTPAGIHGVGGMGKTALSQAFAYKEADAFPGGSWLLRCEGRDRLLAVFRTLVSELQIELTDEEKLDDAKAARRVFDVLRARGPVLCLLDNVDRPALLAQEQMKLLADQPWARALYTTRLAPEEFAKAGAKIRPLDLDRLPENQAVDLIRRYQPGQAFASTEHEAAAREIGHELSGLTLAVETAAVYLGQCDPRAAEPQYAVDVRNYLNNLRDDLKTGGSEGVMSQLREVTATLRPTLARLDAPSRTVLQIASLLTPDGVALPWVRAIAGQRHPELASEAATGQNDPWTQLIRGLIGMRLFRPTTEPRVASIHRILQRVLETELPEGSEALEDKLVGHVKARCSELEQTWHQHQWEIPPLVAFAQELLKRCDAKAPSVVRSLCQWLTAFDHGLDSESMLRDSLSQLEKSPSDDSSDLSVTLSNLGWALQKLGRFQEAESFLRRALELDERVRPDNEGAFAIRCNQLGYCLLAQGRLTEAEPFHRRAVELANRALGKQHRVTLACLANLAALLTDKGDYGEAEILVRQALEAMDLALGPEHPHTLHCLNILANLLYQKKEYAEAEPLMRRVLQGGERVLGPEHPDTLRSVNNLAALLNRKGDYAVAEPLFRRMLQGEERVLGPEHPNTLAGIHNLAALLKSKGDGAGAEPLFRRALEARKRVLGPEHPDTLASMVFLASVLEAKGDYAAAEPLLRRGLEARERTLGTEHPDTLDSVGNLAVLLHHKGDVAGAEPLYRRAMEASERTVGPEHTDTLTLVNNFAALLEAKGDYPGAEPLFRRALEARQRVLGPEHPDTLTSMVFLASLLKAKGDYAAAEPLSRQGLVARERILGPEHLDTLVSLTNHAVLLMHKGDFAAAEPLLRRGLEAEERVLGSEHEETLTSVNNLAALLRHKGENAAAEPLFRRALKARERVFGPEHPATLKILNNLVALLESTGQIEAAIPLRRRAFAALERTSGMEHPDTLKGWNQHSHVLRKCGHPDQAEPIDRRVVTTTAQVLGDTNPLAIHRRNNLVLTLIMLGKLEEARQILVANWRLNCPPHSNTTPRIAFLRHLIALFESQPSTPFLGQIKTLLTGPELPATSDVAVPWDIAYFIEFLKPKLGEHNAEFLVALVAALNDRAKLSALDTFPEWRDQTGVSLNTHWP